MVFAYELRNGHVRGAAANDIESLRSSHNCDRVIGNGARRWMCDEPGSGHAAANPKGRAGLRIAAHEDWNRLRHHDRSDCRHLADRPAIREREGLVGSRPGRRGVESAIRRWRKCRRRCKRHRLGIRRSRRWPIRWSARSAGRLRSAVPRWTSPTGWKYHRQFHFPVSCRYGVRSRRVRRQPLARRLRTRGCNWP